MPSKKILKALNTALGWGSSIGLLSFCVYHFFIHKISVSSRFFVILWSLMGIMSLSRILDTKYFSKNPSDSVRKGDIFIVLTASVIIFLEIFIF
ncbi:hypothetical protein [Crassaminicella profunda]|uniref:hypothetical protein n=1 Tax=Crassaminicella profunda TaxID=1286698 RepID=UPI001CA6829D|nr:hypothetical protein [Crassaminicella profunda]QZY57315.1 hypothetical protein K7H06_10500 [Crassaminicella profunda]